MVWLWLFGLIALGGVVLLVILMVRVFGGGVGGSGSAPRDLSGRSPARRILDERFARGELTPDEYRERVHALGEDAS